jgi:HD-GYP domain-containing protein (c-di-GMP phosphodiesterase class II)
MTPESAGMTPSGSEETPVTQSAGRERVLEWAVWMGALALLIGLVASSAIQGRWPDPMVVALFAGLFLWSENVALLLPSTVRVSPSFLWVLAAVSAFGGHGAVLGSAIVGACGGLSIYNWRRRRYRVVVYNTAQFLLAAAGTALVSETVMKVGGNWVLEVVPAAVAYALINVILVLWAIVLEKGEHPAEVWRDMAPALPNYLAFGLLGGVIGHLYSSLGPLVIVLLVIPVMIARSAFAASEALREARERTIGVFLKALEVKDPYTAKHTLRVARYSCYIGEQLGLKPDELEQLRQAALLHDVGKLAVPRSLLRKPNKLTDEEFQQVQRHVHVCIDILSQVAFLRSMTAAASGHHARYDGGGYGEGREKLEARIVSVADAFDAMTSTRAYRKALDQDVAFGELEAKAGSQFDPDCVRALISAITARGERHGLGYEEDVVEYDVPPPVVGPGSAGLGDLVSVDAPGARRAT